MSIRTVIQGVAHFTPEKAVTNDDLAKLMPTSDEWITERTGIKERRFAEPGTLTSDLAIEAAKRVLDKTNLKPADFDLIVAATLSPDFYFPGIGVSVQHKMGFPNTQALDIRAQCSGFVYGLTTIDAYMRAGISKRALFVCAELQNPVLNLSEAGRDMAVLFGDGAGALVVEAQEGTTESGRPDPRSDERGVIDTVNYTDGSGAETLYLKSPGTATPGFITHETIDEGGYHPTMNGRMVFRHAVTRLLEVCAEILKRNKLRPEDIDLIVPHQANLRINEAVREKLGLPAEKFFNNIHKYGNTTAATIPIALSEAEAEGKLKKGDLVLNLAFGAGFTWGATLTRW